MGLATLSTILLSIPAGAADWTYSYCSSLNTGDQSTSCKYKCIYPVPCPTSNACRYLAIPIQWQLHQPLQAGWRPMGVCRYPVHQLLVLQLRARHHSRLERLPSRLPWLPRRKVRQQGQGPLHLRPNGWPALRHPRRLIIHCSACFVFSKLTTIIIAAATTTVITITKTYCQYLFSHVTFILSLPPFYNSIHSQVLPGCACTLPSYRYLTFW